MIEDQKIGTYTGMTSHLKDQEVRGIGTMTGILKEEKKDQKDADTMIWITSSQGTMKIVNAMKEEGDRYMFVIRAVQCNHFFNFLTFEHKYLQLITSSGVLLKVFYMPDIDYICVMLVQSFDSCMFLFLF